MINGLPFLGRSPRHVHSFKTLYVVIYMLRWKSFDHGKWYLNLQHHIKRAEQQHINKSQFYRSHSLSLQPEWKTTIHTDRFFYLPIKFLMYSFPRQQQNCTCHTVISKCTHYISINASVKKVKRKEFTITKTESADWFITFHLMI